MASHRVDFVDKDEARRGLFPLLEHIAHPARTDANKHLDEIRSADRKERDIRLARDGAREKSLARAGRPDHQHTFRDASAELLKFFRVFKELDDLLHFLLRLLDAGDFFERNLVLLARQHPRLRFAKIQRALSSHPDLLPEEDVDH